MGSGLGLGPGLGFGLHAVHRAQLVGVAGEVGDDGAVKALLWWRAAGSVAWVTPSHIHTACTVHM